MQEKRHSVLRNAALCALAGATRISHDINIAKELIVRRTPAG
jgi:hypothetical protein